MQEYSSISVSTYNPDELVGQLNEQAKQGWDVVSVVPTGSTVTAYLAREATGDTAAGVVAAASSDDSETTAPEPAPEPAHFEVAGVAAATAAEPEATAPDPAAESELPTDSEPDAPVAAEPAAAEPAAQPAEAAAPAGWYADPSSRFELRYWDGTTWTEHVSRGGQQFTDPPVA